MRLPIDTTKVTLLAIGVAQPQIEYRGTAHKTDARGTPLYRIPIVLGGMGERTDPTTTVTVASIEPPTIRSGDALVATNLIANTWTMRDANGRDRSGVTLRADRIDTATNKAPR